MALSTDSTETEKHLTRDGDRTPGDAANTEALPSIRLMDDLDLASVRELRSVVGWAADPRAFDLLRGMREARWAVAGPRDGSLAGMVGAVPLGDVGILCHLAVRDEYRGSGLGARLTSWAVAYLRSRGASGIRLYSTRRAESIYRAAGFEAGTPRTLYRLEDERVAPRVLDAEHRLETIDAGNLSEVYGTDLWSYGADRSALIRATLRQNSGGGFVARDRGGQLKGYLLYSAAGRSTRIGPFMATTPEAARLLAARVIESRGAPIEATVTSSNDAVRSLYGELGFEGREDRLRMEISAMPKKPSGSLRQYATTAYLAT